MDGNFLRVNHFFELNHEDLNINYAIGKKQDVFVELNVNLRQPALSTASKEVVKDQGQSGFNLLMNTSSITLAQLCERYYIKKPAFLNLDVEGFGGFALTQNNWDIEKCRPDVILAEANRWNRDAKSGDAT